MTTQHTTGMLTRGGLGGAIVETSTGQYAWCDTGEIEPAARPVTLGQCVPEPQRAERYGRAVRLFPEPMLVALDPEVATTVRGCLFRFGKYSSMATVTKAAHRASGIWTLPEGIWQMASAAPIGVAIQAGEEMRCLERAERIAWDAEQAAIVQLCIDRNMDRFYSVPVRYAQRLCAAFSLVQEELARLCPDAATFAVTEMRAWRTILPAVDLLLTALPEELTSYARRIAGH